MLRYLSICSGIEAASVAWEPLGFRPVGFSEIEPFPNAVLAERFGAYAAAGLKRDEIVRRNGVPNFGDFTAIDVAAVGPVDILVGGTPCQAFSIAGRRMSLADARGNLTLAYAVLAHDLADNNGLRCAVWENVPGVLSTEDNAFGCFLSALVGADDALLPGPRPAAGRSNDFWRWRKAGDYPVLDDDGEPTGETVSRPAGHVAKWPAAGMAAGPWARVAWRLFDAQHFGLAQRRARVFVVADLGGGPDPATVLFEPKDLHGDFAPGREAGPCAASVAGGGFAFGGGNTGLIDVAACLTAKGQRCDFEVETFVAEPVRVFAIQERAVSENPDAGPDGAGVQQDIAYTLEARSQVQAVAFPERMSGTQVAAAEDLSPALCAANPTAVAFSCKDYGADASALAPTLRAMGHGDSHANAGGQVAVAFDLRGREGGAQFEGPHDTANIRASSGGSSRSYVATDWAVRRLTETECERLQGFPDGHTAIAWGRKAADECPGGPRYKAIGNSKAVPVVRWLGRRIAANWPDAGGKACPGRDPGCGTGFPHQASEETISAQVPA